MAITDEVAMQVIGAPELFAAIDGAARRLDRSPSWVVQFCLKASLGALGELAPDAAAVAAMKIPKGTARRTFYVPAALRRAFDHEGGRLHLSADEILHWTWTQTAAALQALPSLLD